MEELRQVLREFAKAQVKYQDYGASDSEPHWKFKAVLASAIEGKNVRIPSDGCAWELYSASMDCSEAAKVLTEIANKAVNLIQNTPMKDINKVREIVLGW